jgi:hypothetical protein
MYDLELVNFDTLASFAKRQKETNYLEKVDTNPIVVGEKEGNINIIAVCPILDKEIALQAAKVILESVNPDAITLVIDSYMYQSKENGEQIDTPEKFKEKFPKGLAEAYGRDPDVIQAITLCRADNGANITDLEFYPYEIEDGKIKWKLSDHNNVPKETRGDLCRSLKEVFLSDPVLPENVLKSISQALNYSKEEVYYQTARAGIGFLLNKNFQVVDFISMNNVKHAKLAIDRTLDKFYSQLVQSNIFSPSLKDEFSEFIHENLTSPEFVKNLKDFVSINKNRLFVNKNFLAEDLSSENFNHSIEFLAQTIIEYAFSPLNMLMIGESIIDQIKNEGLLNPDQQNDDNFGEDYNFGDYNSWN